MTDCIHRLFNYKIDYLILKVILKVLPDSFMIFFCWKIFIYYELHYEFVIMIAKFRDRILSENYLDMKKMCLLAR